MTPITIGLSRDQNRPQSRKDKDVPKMKTHSGAKKRIKVTGSGRLMRRQSGRGHLRLSKGKNTYRRRSGDVELAPGDARVLKKQLGR